MQMAANSALPTLLKSAILTPTEHFTQLISAQVAALSAVRMHVPKDLRSQEARRASMRVLAEIVAKRFAGLPPLLDPQVPHTFTSKWD